MGLMSRTEGKKFMYKILTDIQGPEDHHGDMDFKVAGTNTGITAIQMDVKVDGVPPSVLREALAQAKKARLEILGVIEKEIAAPRKDLKPSAPRIEMVQIHPDKIGLLIGTGGKTIKKLSEESGASIQVDDDGKVYISGSPEKTKTAKDAVVALTREYETGETLEGVVSKIFDFGAVVELGPNADGLVHISEFAPFRIENINDVICVGEKVPVFVKNKDETGRISLSIVKANPDFIKQGAKKDCSAFPGQKPLGYNNGNGRQHTNGRRGNGRR